MVKQRTLYDVLGVSRSADEATIRAAYNALMKRHHPDLGGTSAAADGSMAAELNAAFAILRNAGRRTRYDAELRYDEASERQETPPRREAGRPVSHMAETRAGRLRPAIYAGAALVGLGTAISLGFVMAAERSPVGPAARPTAPSMRAAPSSAGLPPGPVNSSQVAQGVEEFARVAKQSGLRAAARYSDLCFDEQARTRRADDLDFCVAFDSAALRRWDAEPQSGLASRPAWFQPVVVAERHASAAGLVYGDNGWGVARVGQIDRLIDREAPPEAQSKTAVPPAPPPRPAAARPARTVSVRARPAAPPKAVRRRTARLPVRARIEPVRLPIPGDRQPEARRAPPRQDPPRRDWKIGPR